MDGSIHIKLMRRAINLALLGNGATSPNPLVGAVITNKKSEIISEGYHQKSGMPHAEAMAFNNLRANPQGGSLYVNLEPCCHAGKTPPCVDKIISSGIKRVFISIKDPDSRVAGKGICRLKDAGIDIHLGLCERESLEINKAFIHRNLTGNSYGVLKWAMSIDGRIGLKNGLSKWISNDSSRELVHSMRSEFDAVVVGGNTVRKDNPLLTTRGEKNPEPIRVVFTRTLDLPANSELWDCSKARTLIVYNSLTANENHLKRIPSCVEVEKLTTSNPRDLSTLLAKKGCNKILWECGPKLATLALGDGCIQETMTFISPKIIGGVNAMNPFSDFNFNDMSEVINLKKSEIRFIKNDLYLRNLV